MGLALSRYRELLDALFARTTGEARLGLDRVRALLRKIGDPHRAFASLHVAGTNGKGSVAATLDAVLRGRGVRTGRYTSPHLIDFRERIVVDGEPVPEERVVTFLEARAPSVESTGATFFEATTAMAFELFAEAEVDVAIIETGLGGRLDATNVVLPAAAGVTSIGLDHVELLGGTLEQIAAEKAGIFKGGVPAVIGESDPTIGPLLARHAAAAGAQPVHVMGESFTVRDVGVGAEGTRFLLAHGSAQVVARTPLMGRHQAFNAGTALMMLEAAPPPIHVAIGEAAEHLVSVRIPGRFHREGAFIFDVAHNPAGAAALIATLDVVRPPRPLVIVLGVLRDKDWRAMIEVLAQRADRIVTTQPPTAPRGRAWDAGQAAAWGSARGWRLEAIPDFDRALAAATQEGGTVLVTGSFHTVGDAMARLQVSPVAG